MQLPSFSLTHTHSSGEVIATSSRKRFLLPGLPHCFPAAQRSSTRSSNIPPPNISPPLHSACWLSSTSPAINLLPLSRQEALAYRKIPPLLVDTDDWKWEEWRKRKREGVWFIVYHRTPLSHWNKRMKCLEQDMASVENNIRQEPAQLLCGCWEAPLLQKELW